MVALFYVFVDFNELRGAFGAISATGFLGLLLLATLDRWLMAIKWFQLAKPLEQRPGLLRFGALYYAASFINYCVPAMIGGDVYRAVALARDCPGERDTVYASVVMEKVVALIATLAFAWMGLAIVFIEFPGPTQRTVFSAIALGSAGAAALIVFSFVERLHDVVVRLLQAIRLQKFARFTDELLCAYKSYARRGGLLVRNLGWAMIENAAQIAIWWYAARLIGVAVPTWSLVSIIAVSQFARRAINYVQGGAIAEVLNISLYGLVGIDPGHGIVIALLAHGSTLLASTPGLLVVIRGRARAGSKEYAHVVER